MVIYLYCNRACDCMNGCQADESFMEGDVCGLVYAPGCRSVS